MVFLECYCLMTGNMLWGIQEGRFLDSFWVHRLLVRFADYYFDALDRFHSNHQCPSIWCRAFEETLQRDLHITQALFLGINAHINYDLVFCLAEILEDEWGLSTESDKRIRLQDHRQVNCIIAETIDRVQDEILEVGSPLMKWVDLLGGRLDERLLSSLITAWRENVWESAQAFLNATNEREKDRIRKQVSDSALRKAEIITWF